MLLHIGLVEEIKRQLDTIEAAHEKAKKEKDITTLARIKMGRFFKDRKKYALGNKK